MPWGLTRFHESGQSHFVTFCYYHRRRLLTTDASRRIFESALERCAAQFHASRLRVRSHAGACSPRAQRTLTGHAGRRAEVVEARSIAVFDWRCGSFLAKRYYDFNIRNYPQFVEKLRYIHRNVTGCEGRVESESEWTARTSGGKTLSNGRTAPLKPKPGLSGPPVG